MNSLNALLCSLGACQVSVARVGTEEHGGDLQDFRIEIGVKLNAVGFLRKRGVREWYQRIT